MWVPIIHDTLAYSLLGLMLGFLISFMFNLPNILLMYGALVGLGYEVCKELWLAFMRPTDTEFRALKFGSWLARKVIYRSGRWGCYVYLLCRVNWDTSLTVVHVYKQGWVRNMRVDKVIRVYSRRELLIPYPRK